MPIQDINISKGVYEAADGFEIGNAGNASVLKNAVISETGANYARPGLSSFADIGDRYKIIGIYYFSSHLVVVNDNRKIYKIDSSGTVTLIGYADLGGSSRPVFAEDGDYLAIAGGGQPHVWSGSGMTSAMAGSPVNCSHISYLDGYWINHLLEDQEFRIAGPTAASRLTWDTSDFFQAEALPDNVVSQAVLLREFYSFGKQSIEIFQNYGDTITPFKRSFFIDKGCVAPYSVVQADNTLWFLDSDRRIVKMAGRTPQLISSPYDSVIRQFDTVSDCFSYKVDIDGHYLIVWSFPTEEKTYVYDYRSGNWGEWKGFQSGNERRFKFGGYCYVEDWKKHFVADITEGKVFEFKFSNRTDAGDPRRFVRETGIIDHGSGNRKKSIYYDFHVKRGVGAVDGTEPLMLVSVEDDNEAFGSEVQVGLGNIGDDNPVVRVRIPGIYRRRRLRIVSTSPYEFKLHRIQENVELMVN